MIFRRNEAKEWARENMRGIWAAALTPFTPGSLAIDEAAVRRNFRHWIEDLGIEGFFVAGKQGEFFAMTLEERKRIFEITLEETQGKAGSIMSCSDQNMETVIELAKHAEKIGATRRSTSITRPSARKWAWPSRCGAIRTPAIS
jgi:4-hydroxy-tetrahydrodipicolinate synthase